MPPNTVYVGRPSRWGNPFVPGKDGPLEECLAKYRRMIVPYNHRTGTVRDVLISQLNIEDIQEHLRGKDLACWCPLNRPCHADILLEIANGPVLHDVQR